MLLVSVILWPPAPRPGAVIRPTGRLAPVTLVDHPRWGRGVEIPLQPRRLRALLSLAGALGALGWWLFCWVLVTKGDIPWSAAVMLLLPTIVGLVLLRFDIALGVRALHRRQYLLLTPRHLATESYAVPWEQVNAVVRQSYQPLMTRDTAAQGEWLAVDVGDWVEVAGMSPALAGLAELGHSWLLLVRDWELVADPLRVADVIDACVADPTLRARLDTPEIVAFLK